MPLLLGWGKKKARDRAMELMETVGLTPEMARRYPGQLSGGQQQRVGVARALAADPPVLLMDEPFSAVDPVVRESLQDELLKLQAELGKTIVFVTHDIDEAVKLGDRVAVFRVGGKLAQYDEPGVLLARPADDFVDSFVGRDRGYRGAVVPLVGARCRCTSCAPPGAASAPSRAGRWSSTPTGARWAGTTTAPAAAAPTRTTSSPAARCTTRAPARCAARSTRRCRRRPGRGSRWTATGGRSARSPRTTCWRRWPPPGATEAAEARMGWVRGTSR